MTLPARLGPGLALAAIGAVAFSAKAIIVKLAYRHGVDAVTLIMYRMLFALPLFVALAWWAGRGRAPLTARDWRTVALLGFCGYYLASFLDFAGLQYISASLERLILYLNPTMVLLLSALLFGRRVTRHQLVALAVSYAGVVLVFGHEAALQRRAHRTRCAAGLRQRRQLCGVPGLQRRRRCSAWARCASPGWPAPWPACCASCSSCCCGRWRRRWWRPPVIWLSLLNATACTFAPVLMVMMAIERIGAALAAQTGMIGPLSTIAMGVAILGEPLDAWIGAGTLLVLAGVWLLARAR
jgi:drug/metabolite transporter (DMT)-like permease